MMNYALNSGIILGVVYVITTIILYFLGIEYMVSFWVLIIIFLMTLGLMIYFARNYRALNGGYLTFGDSFKMLITVFAIGGFISLLFNIILYHAIDTDLPVALREATLNKTISIMERFNAPDSEIDKFIVEFENTENQYSIAGLFKSYLWSILFGAIIAAIISLIIKRNPQPDFTTEAEEV